MNRGLLFILFCAFLSGYAVPQGHSQSLSDLDLQPFQFQQSSVTIAADGSSDFFRIERAPTYNGVIVSGSSTMNEPRGAIQFDDDPGTWHSLTFLKSPGAGPFLAGYRGVVFREGVGFTLRFGGEGPGEITLNEGGTFDNRNDEDAMELPDADQRPPNRVHEASVIDPPTLINRAEWGADPFVNGSPVPLARPDYVRMTFHHAACCSANTYEEGITQVKGIQDFHQNVRGWSDIGYHFILDQEGRIYQGRPFLDGSVNLANPPVLAQGAHVGGANLGNVGVAMLGCYHPSEGPGCVDELSPAARDSLTTIFAYINENYGVQTENLFGHRDQGNTACPGDNNYAILPQLRLDIDEVVRIGNQPVASGMLSASMSDASVVLLNGELNVFAGFVGYRLEREINEVVEVIFSGEEGGPFTVIDSSIPETGIVRYALYVTGSRGQEQRIAEAEIDIETPEGYILGEAFPNPFAGSTTIRYFVERDGFVDIGVYDTSGKKVRNLVDAYQQGLQWYQIDLPAEGLANGIYFYRMIVVSYPGVVFDETHSLHLVR